MRIDDIPIEDSRVVMADGMNVVIRARYGLMCINRYSPIGRSLCWYGEHGENEISFCRKFLRPGDVVYDVGAHQGTHTIPFAQQVGRGGLVVSIEPQRLMLQNLVASVALNSLTNVVAVHCAAGDRKGSVRIVDFDYSKRTHFSGMKISPQNTGELVPLLSLTEINSEVANGRIVSFIKIDVESMEHLVVAGAIDLIKRDEPVLYCELMPNDSKSKLPPLLVSLGYRMYRHEPRGFNPNNVFGLGEDRFQGGVDHNVVCVTERKHKLYADALEGLKEHIAG